MSDLRPLVIVKAYGQFAALYQSGKDVFFVELFGDDPALKLGPKTSLAAVVAREGGAVERWSFASEAAASKAARWAAANAAGRPVEIAADLRADLRAWRRSKAVKRPRLPRFEVARSGPVALTVDRTHPWRHPRPPSTSFVSGRLLVPVLSLVGTLDPSFGADTGVYLSACPLATIDPYIDHVFEVLVQGAAPAGAVDRYFVSQRGLWSLHLSLQVCQEAFRYAITEHTCERGTPGFYRTHHVRTRKEADAVMAQRSAAIPRHYEPTTKIPTWYPKVLAEIDHHARVRAQRPRSVRLRPVTEAFVQRVAGPYARPSSCFLAEGDGVGGAPRFCQDDWDFIPRIPDVPRGAPRHLLSFGAGSPAFSEVLNDGDAGTFNLFAAPGHPFGTLHFACH